MTTALHWFAICEVRQSSFGDEERGTALYLSSRAPADALQAYFWAAGIQGRKICRVEACSHEYKTKGSYWVATVEKRGILNVETYHYGIERLDNVPALALFPHYWERCEYLRDALKRFARFGTTSNSIVWLRGIKPTCRLSSIAESLDLITALEVERRVTLRCLNAFIPIGDDTMTIVDVDVSGSDDAGNYAYAVTLEIPTLACALLHDMAWTVVAPLWRGQDIGYGDKNQLKDRIMNSLDNVVDRLAAWGKRLNTRPT